MRAHCEGAQKVAKALRRHPAVEAVLFPGLPGDPGRALAEQQMSGYGAMLSFIVGGGAEAAMAIAGRLKLVVRATSLGGTHSLIEHRASVEGPKSMALSGLLRISVGLEHPQDIIDEPRSGFVGGRMTRRLVQQARSDSHKPGRPPCPRCSISP